ncbi:hypothetical protein C7B65_13370 [Phormidesmis priestleyi ULC007]|uniref:Uncharacterized protein n=1 Tax=Phormidesmis priestleyi ULC007 TaxID=1920490 RepID=A0A2T1DER3_9CYAN|nr:hypothetical protein [Phormidesmis priestleyi]PSB19000.1 hypothetical protein C7B65_13370 [Phormidesmis priestleyi ULC007]PZO53988.1 MAG: hypothetical protein DCF14_03425 [Phormidesmis priestleyi]
MQPLLLLFVAFYSLLMPILFINWLGFFREDLSLTKSEKRLSIVVIAIATLFWPIVIPFAYLELLGKFQRSARTTRLYKKMLETTADSQLC